VERIHDVISVDAVVFPATTGGFREQFAPDQIDELVSELNAAREELSQAIAERDELRGRCERFAAEAANRDLDALLAKSGLPEFAITESLRHRLQSVPDARGRSQLIAEHRELVLRCRQRSPCSRPRGLAPDDGHDLLTRQFVQAVKTRQ
jgi:hypothetical protein